MQVYRGDIYMVEWKGGSIGSEQRSGRPAVVVSNNTGNYHSNMVTVVYLTTQEKNDLPTHAPVMCRVPSIALCEQVYGISKERLSEYIRSCTDEEMKAIDKALAISLGLEEKTEYVPSVDDAKMIDDLKMKLEDAEKMLDERTQLLNESQEICRQAIDKHEIILKENEQLKIACGAFEKAKESKQGEEILKLKTERDLYKSLYEQTFERLLAG